MEYSRYEQKFESGGIRLYQADCMKMLPQVPDKFYELCICDPPYSPMCNLQGGSSRHGDNGWGKLWGTDKHDKWNVRPSSEYFNELRRVSVNQIIWGGNYFLDDLGDTSCMLIWDKGQRDFSLADAEIAWTSFKKPVRIFSYARSLNNQTDRIHVNQKPVRLYEWLLQNYAKPGDRILDTHGGSGSILIACDIMGYDIDAYEIDFDYYEAAKERLERHQRQGVLAL